MALTNLQANITLDVYDHDGAKPSIKTIALDDNTRYVLANIRSRGEVYDIGSSATVQLIVIRPDKVGVQIAGQAQGIEIGQEDESVVTVYGAYAELDQAAIVLPGTLLGQFKITSGDQILRTQIFQILNGEALDSDTWAGQYDGYNLDELVENVNEAVDTVLSMQSDVQGLKEDFDSIFDYTNFVPSKYVYAENGTIQNYDDSNVGVVESTVFPGMVVTYNYTISTSDVRGLSFFDRDGEFITGYVATNQVQTIVVPNNAVKVKATVTQDSGIAISEIISAFGKTPIINEITNINDTLGLKKVYLSDVSSVANSYILYETGDVGSYSGRKASDYIDVLPKQNLVIRTGKNNTTLDLSGLAFYDADKNYVSGIQYTNYNDIETIVPSDAVYMRMTFYDSNELTPFVTFDGGDFLIAFMRNALAGSDDGGDTPDVPDTEDNSIFDYTEFSSGKYVYAENGTIQNYYDTNVGVVEATVFQGMIITYNYTVTTPDVRGLSFFDRDGEFISGYNTSNAVQTITVPSNAVRVKATVTRESGIVISKVISAFGYIPTSKDIDEITGVKEVLGLEKLLLSEVSSTDDSYILYETGDVGSVEGRKASDYINVLPKQNLIIRTGKTSTGSDLSGLAFYDADKMYISGIQYTNSNDIEAIVPNNAVYMRMTFYDSVGNEAYVIFDGGDYIIPVLRSIVSDNKIVSDSPLEKITDNTGMMDIFLKVGCIGDSLASGESCSNENGYTEYHDLYQYSWGQFLARKTGNTYYNWSEGGLRTDTWLASEYAAECYDGDHNCQAYIIGLGQNDYNAEKTVGSISDIDLNDYDNNADTFYGRYAKIIQKIFEINPKAKVFVITDFLRVVENGGYNGAIRGIANLFDNVYLLDMYQYGQKVYDRIRTLARSGHYGAYGYKICAMAIANYIDWIVQSNPSEFSQVEFIDTSWSWT